MIKQERLSDEVAAGALHHLMQMLRNRKHACSREYIEWARVNHHIIDNKYDDHIKEINEQAQKELKK